MKNTKRRIRNFRISEELDQRLRAAAELVGTDPSCLLRDFVKDGTTLIASDPHVQQKLRQRYS